MLCMASLAERMIAARLAHGVTRIAHGRVVGEGPLEAVSVLTVTVLRLTAAPAW